MGAGRAALLQLAHPWVAAALAEHSTVIDRPIARFHNTFRIVFAMIFGSLDQALAAARHLYALHTQIRGEMPEDVARWKRGSRYEANEIGALRWVFATLVESAVLAYDCVLPALTVAEREQYYAECKTLAALFGLPAAALPENWEAFAAYNREMHAWRSGRQRCGARHGAQPAPGCGLVASPAALVSRVDCGVVAGAVPRGIRVSNLAWQNSEPPCERNASCRRIYRRLPPSLRFTGPWHEAQARLAGRRSGALTRWSNRFWIGQPSLPFAEGIPLRGGR